MKFIIIFSLSTMMLASAFADVIELNNGKKIEGIFVGREGDNVKFDADGITMMFNATDVKNIAIGSVSKEATNTSSETKDDSGKTASKAIVPAGTTLVIRVVENLNPNTHAEGHKFTAKLESAIVVDGETLVPVDSNVYGVVLEANKSRRLAGQASIRLGVTDIRVNGQMHKIKTTELTGVGEETAKKSAGQVARFAAIGALADGSSGARTGAKVGAGAALLSGGNQAQIPADTLLEFTLLEPVQL